LLPWVNGLTLAARGQYEQAAVHLRGKLGLPPAPLSTIASAPSKQQAWSSSSAQLHVPPSQSPPQAASPSSRGRTAAAAAAAAAASAAAEESSMTPAVLTARVQAALCDLSEWAVRALVRSVTECYVELTDWDALDAWTAELRELRQGAFHCHLCLLVGWF
jgi:hypothetical protein